jgi:hypothetical protein
MPVPLPAGIPTSACGLNRRGNLFRNPRRFCFLFSGYGLVAWAWSTQKPLGNVVVAFQVAFENVPLWKVAFTLK